MPFDLQIIAYDDPAIMPHLARSSVILVGIGHGKLHLVDWAAQHQVPLVFITEYSFQTRRQIIRLNTANPVVRWRRELWNWRHEQRCVRAMRKAAGLHCNGTPTYETYQALTPRPLLFFDMRTRQDMMVSEADLAARLQKMQQGGPLRLVYSGRLNAMKGAGDLPKFAASLRKLGVAFQLDVFGGGPLEQEIREQIQALELGGLVHMHGVVDFHSQLVPHVSRATDLFVCCHPQGDPACTYLETMACGVPIAGYANEAWRGLQQHCGAGWVSPNGDPTALAEAVAEHATNRERLAEASWAARRFAEANTFEKVIAQRVEHLMQCAEKTEDV